MVDLTEIQSALSTKIIGSDSTGAETNPMAVDVSGNAQTINNNGSGASAVNIQDGGNSITIDATSLPLPTGASTEATLVKLTLAQGSSTSGQFGTLILGAVTTASPTYVTGQSNSLSLTTTGALRVDGSAVTQPISGTVTANQGGTWNINNISGTISLPTGASTSALQTTSNTSLNNIDIKTPSLGQQLAAASQPVVLTAAQLTTLTPLTTVAVTQSTSPWITKDQSDGPVTPGAVASFSQLMGGQFNTALPTLTTTQQTALQVDSSGRLIIAPLTSTTVTTAAEDHNFGTVGAQTLRVASEIGNATGAADFNSGATGAQTLRVVTNQGAANTHANAWFTRLTDGTDDSLITPSGDLQTADIINVSSQYRAQSVTTTAAEALGAATILANRKMLSITPTNGTIYYGFSNTVTTATGSPIFKNQNMTFAVGANVHIWLIAAQTTDVRISEGS